MPGGSFVQDRPQARRREHWMEAVLDAVELWQNVFKPDQTVLGGGNAKFIDPLPSNCRCVDNRSAYIGAQCLWEDSDLFASAYATSWRIHRKGVIAESLPTREPSAR